MGSNASSYGHVTVQRGREDAVACKLPILLFQCPRYPEPQANALRQIRTPGSEERSAWRCPLCTDRGAPAPHRSHAPGTSPGSGHPARPVPPAEQGEDAVLILAINT